MFTKMSNIVDRVVLFLCLCLSSCDAGLKEGESNEGFSKSSVKYFKKSVSTAANIAF